MMQLKSQSQPLSPKAAAHMGKAVQLWLDYQILCGRGMLLSESYLAHPVGEFLRNRHNGKITAEWNHPNTALQPKKAKRGRPKQIDYALFGAHSDHPLTAIEAKWVTEHSRKAKQRFVNDVLRLEAVRTGKGPMHRFFLVAGMVEEVGLFLNDVYNTHANGRTEFISNFLPIPMVDNKPVNIEVENCDPYFRPYFKNFHEIYHAGLPKTYKAALVFDSEEKGVKNQQERIDSEYSERVRVLLWRVMSVSKRSSFLPDSHIWSKVETGEDDLDWD